MDTFPALYQAGAIPLWAVEIWVAAWTVLIVFLAVKLYGKLKASPSGEDAQERTPAEELL